LSEGDKKESIPPRHRGTPPWTLRSFTWRADNIVPLLLIGGMILTALASLEYPIKARALPLTLSAGVIALAVVELLRQWFTVNTDSGQIMDLGMRSHGMEGATRAGLLLGELAVFFLFLATTIRLDNAAIAFAGLLPLLLLQGQQRWLTAAITGSILTAWTYGFMDYFMAVLWPEPVLSRWFLSLF